MAMRYPIGDNLKQIQTLLGVQPERVLRRVGLSASLAEDEDISVDADTYFRIWDAMYAEAGRPGVEMELAMTYAHGPFIPAIFAFSCAETLALGLKRLSEYKPLIGPVHMAVTRSDAGLQVTLAPTSPTAKMSPSMGLFELLYITECARSFTGVSLSPIATTLPGDHEVDEACTALLGGTPKTSTAVSLTFSPEQADLPLITRSTSLWEALAPGFAEQLDAKLAAETLAGRIKQELHETLPGGSTSIDDMARRLSLSKRSLQRKLSDEGTSFQTLLGETRFELSERYLKDSDLSVPEISYLLGFRETSSFFRAFQGWTGMTPGDFRAMGPGSS